MILTKRTSGMALLLTLTFLGTSAMADDKAKPPADWQDDPLPAGCTLRFGTSRYRHGTQIVNLAVSADGKRAVAQSSDYRLGSVRAYDLSTGRIQYTLDQAGDAYEAVVLSPDGTKLATKRYLTVTVHDAATGKELQHVKYWSANGSFRSNWLLFTPDGKGVAVADAEGNKILLIDLEKEAVIRTFQHQKDHYIRAAAFSPDGKLLAASGFDSEDGTYFVRLWEVATGKELRRFPTGKAGTSCLTFSPDGNLLATGDYSYRSKPLLRVFEVATAKERGQVTFPNEASIRSVAFTPDGETVAGSCGTATLLFNTATLKERLRIDELAIGLRFSPDGKVLTGAVAGAIRRWDAVTGKPLTPELAGDSLVAQILCTPDGRKVVTRGVAGDASEAILWDARTGKRLRRLNVSGQRGVALSPDGRYLVWPVVDETLKYPGPPDASWTHTGNRVRLYDLDADKFIDRFPAFKGDAHDLAFTSDGKALVTVDRGDGAVRLWDVATGKEQRTFRVLRENETKMSDPVLHGVLSPDGRTLAVSYQCAETSADLLGDYKVRLWDVATGKELHELTGHIGSVEGMAFAPDGRFLVTGSRSIANIARQDVKQSANQVYVWDVATGARVAPLPQGLPAGATAAAFAPDGRTLATAAADGTVQVWEVLSWSVRAEFRGHRDLVCSLAFGPDGRLLSGGLDTTVLAWDVRPPRPAAGDAKGKEWNDLALAEAKPAFAAEGRLLADAAASVKLFAEKIKPVEAVDAKRLAQLIADLDSAKFDTRDQATRSLRDLGGQAVTLLREAAEKSESAEVRRRASSLLEEWKDQAVSPGELRALRAVEVLEWADTPEARQLLGVWAKGASGARLTREAKAALERLAAKRLP